MKGFVLPTATPKDAFDKIQKFGWDNGQRKEFLKRMIDDPDWIQWGNENEDITELLKQLAEWTIS